MEYTNELEFIGVHCDFDVRDNTVVFFTILPIHIREILPPGVKFSEVLSLGTKN